MSLLERAPSGEGRRAATAADPTAVLHRAALLVGFLWLPIIVLWSGAPFALTFDDAYYYAEIARNVAHGAGSTFDRIGTTNGYHPLWLLLCVPAYVFGLDGLAAIRMLLVLGLACWVGTLWVLAGMVGRRLHDAPKGVAGLSAAVLVLAGANPFVVKMVVNGLESAPVVLVAVLLLDRIDRAEGRFLAGTRNQQLVTGALLGLAFLARTDALLLIGCAAAWSAPEALRLGRDGARRMITTFAPAAAVVVTYLGLNLLWFGHPTQVSGEVKRQALTAGRGLTVLAAGAVALALMAWLHRDHPKARLPRLAAFTRHTGWYPAFIVLLVAYYGVLSSQVWLWYFAPAGLYVIAVLVFVAADLGDGAVAEAGPDVSPRRALAPVGAILAVPLVLGLVIASRQFADPELRSIQEANREAGVWISANLPDDAVLGSWDAGVVGYFTDQRIINLDGVVNSFAYLEASESGDQAEFLHDRDIAYLVNHGPVVDGEDPDLPAIADGLLGDGTGDGLEQVERWEFTYSGTTSGSAGSSADDHMAVFLYRIP